MAKYELCLANDGWRNGGDLFEQLKQALDTFIREDVVVKFYDFHNGDNHRNSVSDLKTDELTLYVVSWYYDNNRERTNVYRDILDDLGICQDDTFEPIPCTEEIVFYIDECPLAVYNKKLNILYLLWDASHDDGTDMLKNSCNIILGACKFFATSNSNENIFALLAESPDNIIVDYNKNIDSKKCLNKKVIQDLEQKIIRKGEEINSLVSKLANANRERNLSTKNLEAMLSEESRDVSILNKYVRHVTEEEGKIIIYTEHIFITDFDKCRAKQFINEYYIQDRFEMPEGYVEQCAWYIGHFKIEVDTTDWNIRFKNLNNRRTGYWYYNHDRKLDMHPHIGGDGRGCFGDLTEMVAFAMSNGDIQVLIDCCIQYLQSVNLSDSAGKYIKKWDCIDMLTQTDIRTGEIFNLPEIIIKKRERIEEII